MQDTTAFEKIENMSARINIIQGGTSAGKTWDILAILMDIAVLDKGCLISVVSDTLPNLKRGAMRDFKNILRKTDRERYWVENKSDHYFTLSNGSVIEFFSTEDEGALGARRDYLFVNEANRINFETFNQLEVRTKQRIYLDFNPSNEFWVHKELMPKRDDWEFLKVNYLDNESLDDSIVKSIEQRKGDGTSNWWRVYGLGEIGSLEGNIYEGWQVVEEIPSDYVLKRYGVDFGFSNDPTAVIAVYENEESEIVLDEKLCKVKMLTPELVEFCKTLPDALFVCDNARPEIIAELQRNGIRAIGSNKTAGEKMNGKRYNIELVQRRKVSYTASSKELEREFLSYAWRKKKSGEVLDEPQDGNDHCLVGDTLVDTIKGQIKIKDLVGKTGYLFSECGKIRKFRNVRQTGIEKTIKITFDNGKCLECSEEHPVYTLNRGIVPAYLLNEHDLIQCVMYGESKNNIEYQTTVQRSKLLEREKRKILQKRTAQATQSTQSSMGILQRKNTERSSCRPYRQRYFEQSDRELKARNDFGKCKECIGRSKREKSCSYSETTRESEKLALLGRRKEMALGEWQENIRNERAYRQNMCSLWERVLYKTIFKKGAFMQSSLPAKEIKKQEERTIGKLRRQNGKEVPVLRKGISHFLPKAKILLSEMQGQGEVCKIAKIERTGTKPVYCLDVYDTSNFSVNGGIIVSNCMDAIAYAIRDMARKPVEYAGIR